jgi:riboflavin synthase
MFTGLVQERGSVQAVERGDGGVRLRVSARLSGELEPGDSVAVNGVCLTAVEADSRGFAADVIAETLRRSSLGPLAQGDRVNLELPLRPADRLGGHFVQGHVDGTGVMESIGEEGSSRTLRVAPPVELLPYVVEKGSIALDGVSLTVASVDDEGFTVALIPETLTSTTLGDAVAGRSVNIEVDLLAKYVEKLVAGRVPA